MRPLSLILIFSLSLVCTACSMIPSTRGDMDEMVAAQEAFTTASIRAASEGNDATALLMAGMAGITSIFTTIGFSRKRRTEAALQQATGSGKIPSLGLPLKQPIPG